MNRSSAFLITGFVFYAIAELTPINDVVALFPIYGYGSGLPLDEFAYFTDFAKPFFMLSAVLALGFFFLAFAYLKPEPFQAASLNFIATWSVILAIPDIIWPLGTPYYEVLKYYFGILSLVLAFVLILLFVTFRFENRWKVAT